MRFNARMRSPRTTSAGPTVGQALILVLLLFVAAGVRGQSAAGGTQARDVGVRLLESGKIVEAIEVFKSLTLADKTDAEAWYFLGVAYINHDEFKKALSSFEKAIRLRPQYAEAHNGLAYALLRRSKMDDAQKTAERSLSINQENADANYILGVIKLRKNERAGALAHADKAIQQNPKLAEAYLLKSQSLVGAPRGTIQSKLGEPREERNERYLEAVEALEEYLRMYPGNPAKQTWIDQLASLKFYLSLADKGAPKSVYSGKEVTTKAQLISKPEPDFTNQALSNEVNGTIVLRAVFAADGTVKHILVLQGLPFGLTERAIDSARRIKFVPATLDGKPVSMFMQLEYNFQC
jgi:tetratricopeptide (TPR) repeat protein